MSNAKPIELLVPLLIEHDDEAFSIFYNQYSKALYGLLFRMLKDESDAENILQDTFVKIWKKVGDFDQTKGSFFTWIMTIAKNTCLDFLRTKKSQGSKNQIFEDYVYLADSFNPSNALEFEDLQNFVKRLEPKYQEVIDLVYFKGYTQQEASEYLNLQLGTIKTRSRIAIRELRKWVLN